jgi:hypothetical protein
MQPILIATRCRKSSGRPPRIDENARTLLKKDVKEYPAATVTPTVTAKRRPFLEHITRTHPQRLHTQVVDEAAGLFSRTDAGCLERDEWLRVVSRVMVA